MEFLPKEFLIKEEYIIKNGGIFLVDKINHTEREINGADLLNYVFEENKKLELEIKNAEEALEKTKFKLAKNLHFISDILEVYKKVPKRLPNGITEKDASGEFVYTYIKKVGN